LAAARRLVGSGTVTQIEIGFSGQLMARYLSLEPAFDDHLSNDFGAAALSHLLLVTLQETWSLNSPA
jgi:hypothetical protein